MITDTGRWFAIGGHSFGEVDPNDGTFVEIQYLPDLDPDVSHPQGISVDPATGEILVGTLGGLGHLIAYDTVTGAFTFRGDFRNIVDIVAMVALADGSLLAFEYPDRIIGDGDVTTMRRFDVTDARPLGNVVLDLPLSQPEPGVELAWSTETWQLVESGGAVFAVVRAFEPQLVRAVVVDPATGVVTPAVCP